MKTIEELALAIGQSEVEFLACIRRRLERHALERDLGWGPGTSSQCACTGPVGNCPCKKETRAVNAFLGDEYQELLRCFRDDDAAQEAP